MEETVEKVQATGDRSTPSPVHVRKSTKMRTALIIVLGVLVLVAIILFLVFRERSSDEVALPTTPAEAVQDELHGAIVYLEGTASVISRDGVKKDIALHGQLLSGETLMTSEGGRAILHLANNDILRIEGQADLSFYQDQEERTTIRVIQRNGRVFHSVDPSSSHAYVVVLPQGDLQALGTQFDVTAAEDRTSVMTFEHQVQYTYREKSATIDEGKRAELLGKGEVTFADLAADDVASSWIDFNVEQAKAANVAVTSVERLRAQVHTEEQKGEDAGTESRVRNEGAITLSGQATTAGVKLAWTTELSAAKGFKIVRSLRANPEYPGDYYVYLNSAQTRTFQWDIADGQEWHFRVCEYLENGACGTYSNDVMITAPSGGEPTKDQGAGDEQGAKQQEDSGVSYATGVTLSGTREGDTVNLSWSISGGDAPKGYKVVWSADSNPVYPGNEYQYLSNGNQMSASVSVKNEGTLHFRVCIYQGGVCGAYSNDLSL